jgi:hypothetical protein
VTYLHDWVCQVKTVTRGIPSRVLVPKCLRGLAGQFSVEPRGQALEASPIPAGSGRQSVAAIHRHDAGAAEAEVVLQRDLRALDLAGFGLAAQVPDELGALPVAQWGGGSAVRRLVAPAA